MADFYAGAPDTVVRAEADPDRAQPWAELGLAPDEYQRIKGVLARRPTEAELAMYSVMWSEHCSYKSSKVHLEKFRELPKSERLLAGIGANAGVVDVGQGFAVTFKVESHNHPSFVEPYQGAATGIGGIVRDILAMGARPIAVMDSLRFGDADLPDTRRVVRGVVSGIGGYGNSLGLPNVGGEVVFDPSYDGNPLVNALCLGVLDKERLQVGEAAGVGNKVILYGAKTGRDGIGGASVLASASFEADGPARRPAVQVGDPFQEKIVTECTLELYDKGLVVGISDFGAAGLACAISETAASADTGMTVTLDAVPLREASMEAWEILISESQERMLAIVSPAAVEEALATCARWGVLATVIGEVTDGHGLIVEWHGETIVDVPPASLAQDGPVYHRPLERPDSQDDLIADVPDNLARPVTGDELRATLLSMAGSPNLCSKKWVTEQYDRYVRGNTVLAHPDDAGIIRLSETSNLGVAMSTDGNGRYTRLDPYAGALLSLLEACRNVAATGAVAYAVTDCLNFGSPEDPAVMWQFAEAIRGIADGCEALELPMTGGNVSFYNSTAGTPINPTPVLGVLGLLQDVTRHTPMGFSAPHHEIWLLGTTVEEFGGSEWAWHTHRHLGGTPPAVDLDAEEALWRLLTEGATAGLFRSAHDLSDGGLAQALVECTLRNGVGARVSLDDDPFVTLFSESAARVLVSVAVEDAVALLDLAWLRGVPFEEIGVTGGDALSVEGQFSLPLEELRVAHEETLPRLFG